MSAYSERCFALDTQESRQLLPVLLPILLLLLQATGLTLAQKVVLFLQEMLTLLGHHSTTVRT